MSPVVIAKAFVIWFGILVLAIANGTFREAILIPMLGKPAGLIVSGIILFALILAVACLLLPWLGRSPMATYIAIGVGWLVLTLAFEFGFGLIIQGKPWSEIFEAYTFKDGNLWPVVLLITAVAPCLAAKIRGWV